MNTNENHLEKLNGNTYQVKPGLRASIEDGIITVTNTVNEKVMGQYYIAPYLLDDFERHIEPYVLVDATWTRLGNAAGQNWWRNQGIISPAGLEGGWAVWKKDMHDHILPPSEGDIYLEQVSLRALYKLMKYLGREYGHGLRDASESEFFQALDVMFCSLYQEQKMAENPPVRQAVA